MTERKMMSLFLLMVCLSGCSVLGGEEISLSPSDNLEIHDFKPKLDSKINSEEIRMDTLSDAKDIRIFNQNLYLLKTNPNEMIIVNLNNLSEEKIILQELKAPSLFAMDENNFYIYDQLLNQVLIYDQEMVHEDTINLEQLSPDATYVDIEVLDQQIYLATNAIEESNAHIFVYDRQGQVEKIESHFSGYLATTNGQLFASNPMEYVSDNGQEGYVSGKNSLKRILPKEEKLTDFISGYFPNDFLINWGDEHRVFVFNGSMMMLDEWDLDRNEYIRTLLNLNNENLTYGRLASTENEMYALFPEINKLYKISGFN